ncbi:MAG: Mut7-C RNAse domain-containing protein [candidate division WOR-3 bacterium]
MKQANKPRLFCDVMLGKLARKLRLLGLDVRYERNLKGMTAYRQAKAEGRLFLTRQHRFRNMPDVLYVNSDKIAEQLEQMSRVFSLKASEEDAERGILTRCSVCNESLIKITREQARPGIPFYIYQIHNNFRRCPKCQRIYWPGSHIQEILKKGV